MSDYDCETKMNPQHLFHLAFPAHMVQIKHDLYEAMPDGPGEYDTNNEYRAASFKFCQVIIDKICDMTNKGWDVYNESEVVRQRLYDLAIYIFITADESWFSEDQEMHPFYKEMRNDCSFAKDLQQTILDIDMAVYGEGQYTNVLEDAAFEDIEYDDSYNIQELFKEETPDDWKSLEGIVSDEESSDENEDSPTEDDEGDDQAGDTEFTEYSSSSFNSSDQFSDYSFGAPVGQSSGYASTSSVSTSSLPDLHDPDLFMPLNPLYDVPQQGHIELLHEFSNDEEDANVYLDTGSSMDYARRDQQSNAELLCELSSDEQDVHATED